MRNRSAGIFPALVHVLAFALAACFLLGATAIAFAGPDSPDKTTGPNADGSEGLPLDVQSSAISQSGDKLTLSFVAAAAIAPGDVDKICWRIGPTGSKGHRYCSKHESGAWRLYLGHRRIPAHADVRDKSFAISAHLADLELTPGPVEWSVSASPAPNLCPNQPTPGTGPQTMQGVTGFCPDLAPDHGAYRARIWHVRATGCTATGPHEVRGGPATKKIALTFDDGPSAYTPAFLAKLRKLKIHATFFMIGQQVSGKGKLLHRMLDDGHELGNHSWNHANLGGGGAGASAQLRNTQAAIKHASGYTPCVFRPPYGATGADLVARAHEQGLASILWTVDPLDWRLPGTGTIVNRVVSTTHKGAIILDHDGGGNRSQTLAAFPQFVKTLKARGYEFVTVSELLGYETKYKLVR